MHNIKKYVAQFKREFHIHSTPTLDNLESIIVHNLYYKLLPYQNNEELFYSLTKNPDIKCKTAIAIRSGDQRYIFYNNNIPPQDRPYIFAHEIAHIYIGHYSRDDGYMDTAYRKEQEANEFAAFLLQKPKNHIGMYISCITLALLISFCALFTQFIEVDGNMSTHTLVLGQHITLQIDVHPSEKIVVVTNTGKKYHIANCKHIKNRINLKIISIKDALANGYTPCLDCFKQ